MVRYEYVRAFEQPDILLSNTWIVVRIDGRGFSKYVNYFSIHRHVTGVLLASRAIRRLLDL